MPFIAVNIPTGKPNKVQVFVLPLFNGQARNKSFPIHILKQKVLKLVAL